MSRLLCVCIFLVLGGLATALPAYAQQDADTTAVRVSLADGSSVVGYIEAADDSTYQFRTAAGLQMRIPRRQVRSIRPLEGAVVDGVFRRNDPNRTRLFFAPTGRPLGRGQGYFADYYVFFPFVGIGVGDRVTLAGGISLLPGSEQVVYAAPKITVYNRGRNSASVGVLAITSTGGREYGGLLYGAGTIGSTEKAFTAGIGFAFSDDKVENSPALMLGGEYQLSNNVKLLTENYVLVGVAEGILLSGGIRFFGERLSADLGLITSPFILDDAEGFPFFPLLSFAYNFGK